MKEKDKELFFKNKLRLIVQFNSLVEKLQNSLHIDSGPPATLRSTSMHANNNFTSSENLEPASQPEQAPQSEPAPQSKPKPFPLNFTFPKEKVGLVLSSFLEDPESKHTDLLFTNTLIDIVYDQIRSLSM